MKDIISAESAKFVILVAVGVVVAGLILYWGGENDVPGLVESGKGFDY